MWVKEKSRKVEKCWKLLENSTSFLEKQKKAVIFLDNWIEIPITYLLHNRNITLNLKHHYQYLIRKKGVYVVINPKCSHVKSVKKKKRNTNVPTVKLFIAQCNVFKRTKSPVLLSNYPMQIMQIQLKGG
uniref:Uncharacterized protein n=1 Tax=Cacopsylla melanoneura TaxID=428564 RepID=A0A8D8WCB2_9HEMI